MTPLYGTCPRCGKKARLSSNRKTVLAHRVRDAHLLYCPRTESGDCPTCGPVFKDGRGCPGRGRVAVEQRVWPKETE